MRPRPATVITRLRSANSTASSPTGSRGDHPCVGQLRAGESRPRATARHRDRQRRSTPQQSLLRRGSRRCRSSSDRSRTGNYRFESAGRGRSAASSGSRGDHPRPVGELDAASSPTGKWVITRGDCRAVARGRVSPARNCPTSSTGTGNAITPQQSLLRRGSRRCRSSSDRSRTGNYRFESAGRGRSAAASGSRRMITHGFRSANSTRRVRRP